MTEGNDDPDHEELAGLFDGVLSGDPVAPARLAELIVPILESRFRGVTGDPPVASTIGEVVARLLADPAGSGYDPGRGPLIPYLYRKVEWRLRDERRTERRHSSRRADETEHSFAIRADESYLSVEEGVLERLSPGNATHREIETALGNLAEWSHEDRVVAQLMADGERNSSVYARALAIDHLAKSDMERIVKRAKDRVAARFKKMRSRR